MIILLLAILSWTSFLKSLKEIRFFFLRLLQTTFENCVLQNAFVVS